MGRWSRRKRQACGPRETSCSLLFCDKTRLEGTTVHRAAAAAAAAFKPTTHHRPADKSRISALRSLHWPGHHRDENYDHSRDGSRFNFLMVGFGGGGGAQQLFQIRGCINESFFCPGIFWLGWHRCQRFQNSSPKQESRGGKGGGGLEEWGWRPSDGAFS